MSRQTWLIMLGVVLELICSSLAAQFQTMAAGDFEYTGDKGPNFWQEIAPSCAPTMHSRQSPIDFAEVKVDPNLKPLQVISTSSVTTLANLGHTIVATPASPATMMLNGTAYALKEFHFHTLSEHTMLKQHGVMELHAVFADVTESKLAVIGVIYKLGNSNQFLHNLLINKLPQKTTSPPKVVEGVDVKDAFTDVSKYFNYSGSLTTPPCSENVEWFVLQTYAELSEDQYEEFRKILGNNFRPLQNTNGRIVHVPMEHPSWH